MKPEDWIKRGIRNETHMSPVSNQRMYLVVDALYAVVADSGIVRPGCVGERSEV